MKKNRRPDPKDAVTSEKEETLKMVVDEVNSKEDKAEAIQELLADKVYSYMETQPDGTFRKRSFRYKDRTEKDILHFVKQIAEQWDAAPVDSKMAFMAAAFPAMRSFLKKNDPELLMALLYGPEVESLGVVN